ncbi:cell wall hydrolase [Fulvimarina endophytica]|uniref:Cell wall hydrolase n=1 Tax=Fulvimarina endophytica TaxID=2293836 RepID=A0A371WYV9_9HYPH|nr:cell wall hydrolase [Fulvimarina endophytica]RFC62139.1 cell wall hydrolase [Fulvimarina endophytica]
MRVPLKPVAAALTLLALSGCASFQKRMSAQECLARAMYFESNRTSEEGMVAVGTVVMNRVESPEFPNSVCAVVGQKNQFAPGVLSKRMEKGRELAFATAAKVLGGTRHGWVGNRAMFFHTAGYSFPYKNMHYVAILGGNSFYEKRRDAWMTQDMVAQRQNEALRPRKDGFFSFLDPLDLF